MIDRTFQLIPGVGPAREKELWRRGIRQWSDFPTNQVGLSLKADLVMRAAIDKAREALDRRDVRTLAAMLPRRERWRLFPHFADECAYLDIETDVSDPDGEVTAVGVLYRGEVHSFVPGFNLAAFETFGAELPILVTFNGICFDVPVLERYFRHLRLTPVHLDLRFAGRAAGLEGGLKRIENEVGLQRPPHLQGVSGFDAVRLWQQWRYGHDRSALQRFVEYNLYDAVQLKPLLERIYNRSRERELAGAEAVPETDRSEVLPILSRLVASFGAGLGGGADARPPRRS
jgi:uncharacterized protein